MLPLVDELVINVGASEDGTEEFLAQRLKSPKIRIIHSTWDDTKTDRGLVLSEQTNIALEACRGRWALYLQADEALHEDEHAEIRKAIELADREESPVDGLRLRYLHFYGGYTLIQSPWNWYPNEIRVVRRASNARSFGDAQTFRVFSSENGEARELRSRLIDAHVFHYGHARAPEVMKRKIRYFHRFWHGDAHGIEVEKAYKLDWKNLVWYWDSHPAPYRDRIEQGRAWSPSPSHLGRPEGVVIVASPRKHALAEELRSLIEKQSPDIRVEIIETLLSASVKPLSARSALVDLDAESRWMGSLALFSPALRARFPRRIAHVPGGRFGRAKAGFYTFLNRGRHQTAGQGFQVPDPLQTRQLGRWLGIDF